MANNFMKSIWRCRTIERTVFSFPLHSHRMVGGKAEHLLSLHFVEPCSAVVSSFLLLPITTTLLVEIART
jgi:hypothetical protein